jgi:hypothetical protein
LRATHPPIVQCRRLSNEPIAQEPTVDERPGRLRVTFPPISPRELPRQRSFIAVCVLVAMGLAINIVAVRHRIYVPAVAVLLLLLLSVAVLVVNQLLSETVLEVDHRQLTREVRTPILGRRIRRYDLSLIHDVVADERPVRIVLVFERGEKTVAYVRSKERAHEISSTLRAMLQIRNLRR